MCPDELPDDPVPPGIVLDLDEAFRVLEGLRMPGSPRVMVASGSVCRMSWQTVIRLLHGRLGLDEGGVV